MRTYVNVMSKLSDGLPPITTNPSSVYEYLEASINVLPCALNGVNYVHVSKIKNHNHL